MPATTLIAIMRGVKREEFFVPIMICTIFMIYYLAVHEVINSQLTYILLRYLHVSAVRCRLPNDIFQSIRHA